MKKRQIKKQEISQLVLVIISFIFIIFTILQSGFIRYVLLGRAQVNVLNLTLSLQGSYMESAQAEYKTKVTLYTTEAKVKEFEDLKLIQDAGSKFKLSIPLSDLPLDKLYLVYVKPDKFIGKKFCSKEHVGQACTTPEMLIKSGENNFDFSDTVIMSGDIKKQDGKVDSYDISKIITDIGKITLDYLDSDINSDKIVNSVDYSLVLYSLSQSAKDDTLPTIITPTVTPVIQASPTVSIAPTIIPTTAVSITPTKVPTSTPIPSPTQVAGGTCKAVVNGKIVLNVLFSEECYKIDNEPAEMCVDSASKCTQAECIKIAKEEADNAIKVCANEAFPGAGGFVSLNEQKTQINCTVQFIPGACNVPSPPPIDCSGEDDIPKC
jgi:hypothetical protein